LSFAILRRCFRRLAPPSGRPATKHDVRERASLPPCANCDLARKRASPLHGAVISLSWGPAGCPPLTVLLHACTDNDVYLTDSQSQVAPTMPLLHNHWPSIVQLPVFSLLILRFDPGHSVASWLAARAGRGRADSLLVPPANPVRN
jgi:hypothetical protein